MGDLKQKLTKILEQWAVTLDSSSDAFCDEKSYEISSYLLEFESFPKEFLDFYQTILTNQNLYGKPGSFRFLRWLTTMDSREFAATDLDTLASAILENYSKYQDELMYITICDWVANICPMDKALKFANTIQEIEKSQPLNFLPTLMRDLALRKEASDPQYRDVITRLVNV